MHDRRIFLDWHNPALHAAVDALVGRYASARELDLRGVAVVLPGARAGRRLKEVLVAEAARRRLRLTPPAIGTVGHLPERLYQPRTPPAGPARNLAAWSGALRATPRHLMEPVVRRPPAAADLRGWLELARQVNSLHATVAAGGLLFRQVAAHCERAGMPAEQERWQLLAGVQAEWVAALAAMGRSDVHLERIAALEEGRIAADAHIWLLGVTEMPLLLRRMLHALPHDAVTALVAAPDTHADTFDALGCVAPEWWGAAHVPVRDSQLAITDRPADQADLVARAIAACNGEFAADEIAVAVPDAEVVPFIEERLAAAGVPARYAAGSDVDHSPPARLLAAVADVLDSDSAAAWAALVRHPDAGDWIRRNATEWDDEGAAALRRPNEPWLGAMDNYIARHLPARMQRGAGAGRVMTSLMRGVRRDLLQPFAGSRSLAAWMPAMLELLLAVYGAGRINRERPEGRALLGALTRIRDAAAELHALPNDEYMRCDAATAIRILLDTLRDVPLPPEPEQAAVELLGWLEMHLDDAPVAILTGVSEAVLPESVNAHPFLPDSLRSALGLEDNARRLARDAYQLTALLHARRRVHVVAGRRSAAGDPLRPSRLLLAVPPDALPARLTAFYTGTTAVTAPQSEHPPAEPPRPRQSAFALPPEKAIRLHAPIERMAVSDFSRVLHSPYLFVLDRNARLRAVDDSGRELDPASFGGLAHHVLQHFGSSPAAALDDPDALAAALDSLLDAEAARQFGSAPLTSVRLQVEQLRARLHAFARWQAARRGDGWHIVATEAATPEEGVPFDVDGVPIRLSGRIDRIDRNEHTGAWAVFDYKTGERPRTPDQAHRRGRAGQWVDLQLPLYRHILHHVRQGDDTRAIFSGNADTVELAYVNVCSSLDAIGHEPAAWTTADLLAADEVARDCVRLLRAGPFAWEPVRGFFDDDMSALLGLGRLTAWEDASDEDDDVSE